MAQESLHRAQPRSYGIEERGVSTPERVPIDAVKLQPFHRGCQLPAKQVAAAERRTTSRSEHQGIPNHNLWPACHEDRHCCSWQRHRAVAALGFELVKVTVVDGLANP